MRWASFVLIFWASVCSGQMKPVPVFVSNGVFVRDTTIAHVLDVWEHYLGSRPDSSYDNPYWNSEEKKRYPVFDLASDVLYPSLYILMHTYKPTVLSISQQGVYYKIRTLYSAESDSGFADPVEIEEVYAKREEGGFKLYNALPINTTSWKHKRIGSINFIFPPYHTFDRALAAKMSLFADSVASILNEAPIPVDFYFANTLDELMKARGLDYRMGEGNSTAVGGHAWPEDRMLFGAGTNEWYPHELVHIYFNPKYPKSNEYFAEGIAVLLGGTRGRTLHELICHADSLLRSNPSIRFDSLLHSPGNDALDYTTGAHYLVGGLLMKMAFDKGGWPLCKRLLTYGDGPDEVLKAVEDIFGDEPKDFDSFIKKEIHYYAQR